MNRVKTPKPTRDKSTYLSADPTRDRSTYLTAEPTTYLRGEKQNKRGEILAVDVNGEMETSLTGYSQQTKIAGLISIGLVSLVIAYSVMNKLCKGNKNDQYIAIEEQQVV